MISWFCDICAILWFRESVTSGLINRDDPFWSEHLHVLENCEFGMSWFLQPWPPSNLRACEFGCCSWGTTTWNPSFMLFETKLAGIDTFRCLEYRLQVLNKVGWFFIDKCEVAGISFWQTEFVTYFVLTERVWTHYFGGTKIVWTAVWTELLQFESVNVCFLWSCAGGDFTALLDVVLSPNDDTCQSIQVASSYVLLTVMRDWRLKGTNTSIGCVLSASCLWKKK